MKLKNTRLLSKKLIGFLLISLIFPVFILAQEPDEGVLLTGLFTDSNDSDEQEILQGAAKTFNVRLVWTYDQTDIITGPLGALATAKDIATPVNGLEEPLLSEISGYQKKTIAHSAGVITAVSLAKQGKLWGDELYIVSPTLISQEDLRIVRDLASEGKGFKEIVVYSGDDIIPNFKEVYVNFSDYSNEIKITETWSFSVKKLIYEDRRQEVDLLETFLDYYSNLVKERIGKGPLSATIYGAEPGNKFEIKWEDGTVETFYLQTDAQTGKDFLTEEGITVIPLYEGFPHGRAQLELLAEFKDKYGRYPGREDLELFRRIIEEYQSKSKSTATTARDPNEKLVSPEGDILPGTRLSYTINYENEGEGIAYGVYITDILEEDLDASTLIVNDSGSYDPNTRTITWFIGELQSKEKGSVSFSVNVKEDVPDSSEVINFAAVYFPSVPEITRTNGTVNYIITGSLDTTPPVTTISVSPSPNLTGWNNTDVAVSLSSTDNEGGAGAAKTEYSLDGINWVTYATSFSIANEGTSTIYYKSTDNAGNIEPQKSLIIKIDKTPPAIASRTSPEPNSYGWNNTDVIVSFIATDGLSGIAAVTEPVTLTSEGADQYIGGEAVDLAGNSATSKVVVNIDMTPPEVIINVPAEGAEYILNARILAAWLATDILSGIDSAVGTVPTGSTIDATSVGLKSFNVVAMDKAGNKIELPLTYNVRYSYSGILPPINQDGSSIFKLGRAASVKFQLKDDPGNYISTAVARIYLNKISNDVIGSMIEAESVGEANTGNLFRYSSTDNQYIFNLGTGNLSEGTWQIKIELDDDSSKYATISFR